jgi:hypothetical protein
MGGTELTENVCYFVSIISEFQAERAPGEVCYPSSRCGGEIPITGEVKKSLRRRKRTYLKSALASPKPSASAKTASLEAAPKSLSANIARYRSNKGDFVFKSAVLRSGIDWGRDEGAGSIVGKSGLVVSSALIVRRGPCPPSVVCAKTSGSCLSTIKSLGPPA